MTEKLPDAQKKRLEMSYDSDTAEMAASTIHNIRGALSPIVGAIDMLAEDLEAIPTEKLETVYRELAQGNLPAERKEALIEYLGLGIKSLAELAEQMKRTLGDTLSSAQRIEYLLDVQQSILPDGKPDGKGSIKDADE